jgi:hypothetical protein
VYSSLKLRCNPFKGKGDKIDLFNVFSLLTLEIVGRTAFSIPPEIHLTVYETDVDFGFIEKEDTKFFHTLMELTDLMHFHVIIPLWRFFAPSKYRELVGHANYVRNICFEMVKRRRKEMESGINVSYVLCTVISNCLD